MAYYDMINAVPSDTLIPASNDITIVWNHKLPHLWRSAMEHVSRVCTEIYILLHQNGFPRSFLDSLRYNHAWKRYSAYTLPSRTEQMCAPSPSRTSRSTFYTALKELEDTACALETLRIRSILDYWFDAMEDEPSRVVSKQQTSDSCETDNDRPDQFLEMRRYLERFYNNDNQVFAKTWPLPQRRMRKDIRAWARLAGYSCIKLSCGSMLLHKSKLQLPRRRRKTFKPSSNKDFVSETAYDPLLFPLESMESFLARHRRNAKVWQPRDSYAGYSSADSNDSYASDMSANSANKKRRLDRIEGGYISDFQGCGKAFNRQCDLSHHQRSHRPKDELPCACEGCDQRFGFPKDLRRHEKSCPGAGTSEDT